MSGVPARLRRWLQSPVGYALYAAGLMALLYLVIYNPLYIEGGLAHRALSSYLRFQAHLSAFFIRLLEPGVSVRDDTIYGRFPLQVVLDCASLDVQAICIAAVVAFPTRLPKKLVGIVLVLVVIGLVNALRIAALYFAGAYSTELFDLLHEDVMLFAMLVTSGGLYGLWALWAGQASASPGPLSKEE